jgi:hypothetical protein
MVRRDSTLEYISNGKSLLFWRAITFTTFILLMELHDSKSYFNAQR